MKTAEPIAYLSLFARLKSEVNRYVDEEIS